MKSIICRIPSHLGMKSPICPLSRWKVWVVHGNWINPSALQDTTSSTSSLCSFSWGLGSSATDRNLNWINQVSEYHMNISRDFDSAQEIGTWIYRIYRIIRILFWYTMYKTAPTIAFLLALNLLFWKLYQNQLVSWIHHWKSMWSTGCLEI